MGMFRDWSGRRAAPAAAGMSAARYTTAKVSKERTRSGRRLPHIVRADRLPLLVGHPQRIGPRTGAELRKWLVPRSGHKRLSEIRADAAAIGGQLRGIEIEGGEAAEVRKRLRGTRPAEIAKTGDFLEWWNSQPQLAFRPSSATCPWTIARSYSFRLRKIGDRAESTGRVDRGGDF